MAFNGLAVELDPEFALPPENVPRELKECDEEKHAESLKKKSQIFTVSMNPRRHVTIYDNAAKFSDLQNPRVSTSFLVKWNQR